MKSRTLSCNKTIIRKDITRFAPLWALYLIGGLMVILTISNENGHYPKTLTNCLDMFSIINLVYAAAVAQMVFGDLFNSRLCYALHAMPMRRESWFVSHCVSGVLFSLVPHLIALPLLMVLCGELWFVALWWLLGMLLSYLFFLGVAVFSVFCTGNRFSMTAVYCMINFGSWILWLLADTLYIPMLKGVTLREELFRLFSPVTNLAGGDLSLICFETVSDPNADIYSRLVFTGLGDGWLYLALVAVIGVVLMLLALLMYRRRALETAGDFVAVKPMKPIFCVVFSLSAGCMCYLIGALFHLNSTAMIFLFIGLIVGYFAAQMMLHRMVRVFNKKSFLWLTVLLVTFGASLGVTAWDPLGVVTWVPEASEVEYAELDRGSRIDTDSTYYLKLTDEDAIEILSQAHSQMISQEEWGPGSYYRYTLRYRMKNGIVVERQYEINGDCAAAQSLASLYNNMKIYLESEDYESLVAKVEDIYVENCSVQYLSREHVEELWKCICRDIENGNLGLNYNEENDTGRVFYISIYMRDRKRDLMVSPRAVYTTAWIRNHANALGFNVHKFD